MTEQIKLLITPRTRVGELLDAYPHLEEVLVELAPAFGKLKNPLLRKTVGKIATLQQAASVGNIPVSVIINTLRAGVGQELYDDSNIQGEINFTEPDWFSEDKITVRFDAIRLINTGQNPMQEIFSHLEMIATGEIFMLSTPFVPAPIIELINKKGYPHFCHQSGKELWITYFLREIPI